MLHDLMLQTSQQGRAEEGGREGGRGRGSGADPGRVRPALPAAASRSIHDTHAANQSIEALIDTCLDRHSSSCGHLHELHGYIQRQPATLIRSKTVRCSFNTSLGNIFLRRISNSNAIKDHLIVAGHLETYAKQLLPNGRCLWICIQLYTMTYN